jgi:hypothetical protein
MVRVVIKIPICFFIPVGLAVRLVDIQIWRIMSMPIFLKTRPFLEQPSLVVKQETVGVLGS